MPAARSVRPNKELSAIFRHMADCYRYIGPAERFRASAYETASRTLANMQEPVDALAKDLKQLEGLKGIGKSIAEKIVEYLGTAKISAFEKLKKKVPYQLLELMDIEGFGPATVKLLHEKLNINSKEDLITALEKNQLDSIKGIAAKKIANMKQVLKLDGGKKRIPFARALQTGETLLKEINKIPGVHQATLAGSIRRKKETIGDIDIVLTAAHKYWKKIIKKIISLPLVDKVLAAGTTKASILLKKNKIQADIRIVHDDEYGAAMLYFTGSREHTIQLRTIAKQKGWKVNEYGVYNARTGKRLAGNSEEEIYALFGLDLIPPEQRKGEAELEKIKKRAGSRGNKI